MGVLYFLSWKFQKSKKVPCPYSCGQLGTNIPHLRVRVDEPGKHHVFWDKSWCIPMWVPCVSKTHKAPVQVGPGELLPIALGILGPMELIGPDYFRPAYSNELVVASGSSSGFHSPSQPACIRWASKLKMSLEWALDLSNKKAHLIWGINLLILTGVWPE